MKNIAVSAHSVGVFYENTPILQDVNAVFEAGKWTAIAGPNGAGKTTLLQALSGLISPGKRCVLKGEISLFGKNIQTISSQERGQRLTWLAQGEAGALDWRVRDVVALGRLPHLGLLGRWGDADEQALDEALLETDTYDFAERRLGELSAGQQQRVRLARVLATQAQVLLLDEPLSQLDLPHQFDLIEIIRRQIKRGITVISVMHELQMALMADEMLILKAGQVIHQGACDETPTHRALERAFEDRIKVREMQGERWVSVAAKSSYQTDH